MTARTIARHIAVALMGLGVMVATGDGFAQSYAGLYGWAVEHDLHGWKADSFPLLVDTFVLVGELGLFLLAIDGHRLRRALLPWVDLLVPGLVAAGGWTASLTFNVGRVRVHDFATEATAAVPPLASMIGLLVLLRTLHRYVAQAGTPAVPESAALPDPQPVAPPRRRPMLRLYRLADLDGKAPVPGVPPARDAHRARAVSLFAEEVRAGKVPSIRTIKRRLRVGQDKAQEVRAYLTAPTERLPVPAVPAEREASR